MAVSDLGCIFFNNLNPGFEYCAIVYRYQMFQLYRLNQWTEKHIALILLLLLQCRVCTDAVDALEILLKAFGPEEKIIKDFAEAVSSTLTMVIA